MELQFKRPQIDIDTVVKDLTTIVNTAHIIEANHHMIMYHVEQLAQHCTFRATACLAHYITYRLAKEPNKDRMEESILTFMTLVASVQNINLQDRFQGLQQSLDSFLKTLDGPMSACVSDAMHVLIWQKLHAADESDVCADAILWCRIGLHALFDCAGDEKKCKLQRQLVSYYLSLSSYAAAGEILDNMTLIQKNHKHSRYLSYCLALRTGDQAEAHSCLNAITNGSGDNNKLLFACVKESIDQRQPFDTVRLLQRIVDQRLVSVPNIDETASLLKYTAVILKDLFNDPKQVSEKEGETLARFCAVFRSVHLLQQKTFNLELSACKSTAVHWHWFLQISFEYAIRNSEVWPRKIVIDLLHYSSSILISSTGSFGQAVLSDEHQQQLCDADFTKISLYALESRNVGPGYSVEDLPESSYSSRSKLKVSDYRFFLYQQVLQHYSTFLGRQEDDLSSNEEQSQNYKTQLHVLIPVAFEALLYVTASNYVMSEAPFDQMSVKQFLSRVAHLGTPTITYAVLVDVLLSFANQDSCGEENFGGMKIPTFVAAKMVGSIVQSVRNLEVYDTNQAARWLRCMVQLVIDDVENIAEEESKCRQSVKVVQTLVEQVRMVAASSGQGENAYPMEELEWVAARSFNMAIDLQSYRHSDLARQMAALSVSVTETMMQISQEEGPSSFVKLVREKISQAELSSDEGISASSYGKYGWRCSV